MAKKKKLTEKDIQSRLEKYIKSALPAVETHELTKPLTATELTTILSNWFSEEDDTNHVLSFADKVLDIHEKCRELIRVRNIRELRSIHSHFEGLRKQLKEHGYIKGFHNVDELTDEELEEDYYQNFWQGHKKTHPNEHATVDKMFTKYSSKERYGVTGMTGNTTIIRKDKLIKFFKENKRRLEEPREFYYYMDRALNAEETSPVSLWVKCEILDLLVYSKEKITEFNKKRNTKKQRNAGKKTAKKRISI